MLRIRPVVLSIMAVLIATAAYADDALVTDADLRPATDPVHTLELNFEQESTIERLGKLRNLSLLTLVKSSRAWIFVGVNEEGVVGLHFNASAREADERYLELARLPYLTEAASVE